VRSPGANDDFTDSLAQSIQTLWTFKGLPPTTVAGESVKGTWHGVDVVDLTLCCT